MIPFPIINNTSMSVNSSSSTFVYSNAACYANLGADKKMNRIELIYFIHLLQKLSDTSANNNVSF